MTEVNYPLVIEVLGSKGYDEISAFLGRMVKRKVEFIEGKNYYYLNEGGDAIVRTIDLERGGRMELSNKVEQNVLDMINYIKKIESVRDGEENFL